jgi:anti-anti-sigma factor
MDWNDGDRLWFGPVPGHPNLVRVGGDLDLFTADRLRRFLASPAMERCGPDIELDLAHCTFLDAAGVHAVLQSRATLASQGKALRITNAGPEVRELLEGIAVGDRPIDLRSEESSGAGLAVGNDG